MTRTYEDSPDDTGTISNDTASSVSEEAAGALSELDPENFQDRGTESPGEALRVRWTDKFRYLFGPDVIYSVDSSMILNVSLNISVAPRHGSPQILLFPFAWATRQGPVFKWYHKQESRVFRTIQYRKEKQKPFFHEFIVLELLDGWICRVERMGDPQARVEALTSGGTTAYDIIQLHPPDALKKINEDSDVIMKLTFPRQIDILHVLAICYAIKKGDHGRQYTLQRYNCYFFSWSIILILARNFACWERIPQAYTWDCMTPRLSDALSKVTSLSAPGEIAFRLTRLLTPNKRVPSDIFIEELRPLITSVAARDALSESLHMELWSSQLGTALERAFLPIVFSAARNSAQHRYVGQAILEDPHSLNHMRLARAMLSMQTHISKFHPGLHKFTQRMPMQMAVHAHHAVLHPNPMVRLCSTIRCRIRGALLGAHSGLRTCHTQGTQLYLSLRKREQIRAPETKVPVYKQVKAFAQTGKFCLRYILEHIKTGAIQEEVSYLQLEPLAARGVTEIDNFISDIILSGLLDLLESDSGLADRDRFTKAVVYAYIESKVANSIHNSYRWRNTNDPSMQEICLAWAKCWERWLWQSTRKIILQISSDSVVKNEPKSLFIVVPNHHDGSTNQGKLDNTTLQSQINRRIHQHSQRVAIHRLGVEDQVRGDIKKAIDTAWMNYISLDLDITDFCRNCCGDAQI